LPYWQIPKAQEQARVDEDALVDELGHLLKNSVTQKLVADVPVGVLLSGGLDSSIVTAIAATSSPKPIRTFTVGFPGNDRFDERQYARQIASHFGTIHEELEVESCDINLIDDLAFHFDEPLCDSSIIPTYLVAKLVRSHCTVALGGDGGDELFGGYFAYQRIMRMQHWRAITPRLVRIAIATIAKALISDMNAAQNTITAFAKKSDDISDLGLLFPKRVRRRLCGRRINGDSESRIDRLELSRGMPGACMIHDFRYNLPNDLLVKIDRASMAHSLEMRAPFLDPDIIEFAYTKVPNHLRATGKERKILLKKLARKLLPEDHDLYRKQGFWAPIGSWMSDKTMYRKIIDRLSDNILFDGPTIRSLFPTVVKRRMAERLFSLIMLDAWMRRHGISAA
jgi:asparagine synthase (glutamine-hydrolysing)